MSPCQPPDMHSPHPPTNILFCFVCFSRELGQSFLQAKWQARPQMPGGALQLERSPMVWQAPRMSRRVLPQGVWLGWASPPHTALCTGSNVALSSHHPCKHGEPGMAIHVSFWSEHRYCRCWMELLALKQDHYVILEHSLREMVYGLLSHVGGFSELTMSAVDSLFSSWLIHKCATLYSNYCICLSFQS